MLYLLFDHRLWWTYGTSDTVFHGALKRLCGGGVFIIGSFGVAVVSYWGYISGGDFLYYQIGFVGVVDIYYIICMGGSMCIFLRFDQGLCPLQVSLY